MGRGLLQIRTADSEVVAVPEKADSWNAAARSGTLVSSAKGSIHGAEWPVSPAGLPHWGPASKIRGMATVEECLEHADELAQRVVNAWAGNADADHRADITDEYNAFV